MHFIFIAPLSNPTFAVRRQDQNLVNVLETIGINPSLISRNFTTAYNPIPTNLPAAPKILKNAGNYEMRKDRFRRNVIIDNEDVSELEEKEKISKDENENENENNEDMYVSGNYWQEDVVIDNKIDTQISNDKKDGGKYGADIGVDKDDIYNDYSDNDYEIDTTNDITTRDDADTYSRSLNNEEHTRDGVINAASISISTDSREEVKNIVMNVDAHQDTEATPNNSNVNNQVETLDNNDYVESGADEMVKEKVDDKEDYEAQVEVEVEVAMKKGRKSSHESRRRKPKKEENNAIVMSEKEIENELLFLTNRVPKTCPVLWGVRTPCLVIEPKKIVLSKKNRRKHFNKNNMDDSAEIVKSSVSDKGVIVVSESASNEETSDFLSVVPVPRYYARGRGFSNDDENENENESESQYELRTPEIIEKRIGPEYQADIMKGIPGHSDYIDGYISELSDEVSDRLIRYNLIL